VSLILDFVDYRRHVDRLIGAALAAAEPGAAVRRWLRREDGRLVVDGRMYEIGQGRLFLVGVGKAAGAMGAAAAEILGAYLTAGVLVSKDGQERPVLPASVAFYQAGHPVPDEAGVRATAKVVELVGQATAGDLVVCLISGGASALLTRPVIPLADWQQVVDGLLASGCTIQELNGVRRQLDEVKGGGLARLIAPAGCVSLILSDVVGNRLEVIGSGPTVVNLGTQGNSGELRGTQEGGKSQIPNPKSQARGTRGNLPSQGRGQELGGTQEGGKSQIPNPKSQKEGEEGAGIRGLGDEEGKKGALGVLRRYGMGEKLPAATWQNLYAYLTEQENKPLPAGEGVQHVIIGDVRQAAEAAMGAAAELGFAAQVLTAQLEGEAREVGRVAAALAKDARPTSCLILGGETTVTIRGKGKGGRNQELALAAAIALDGIPNVVVASFATDGDDGPTDAAGAVATGETAGLARAQGLDPPSYLARNDSYRFFDQVGGLLRTGPTGTNVNDLILILKYE
jgi:glycerate 2-kinase